jgi:hypothetical protein
LYVLLSASGYFTDIPSATISWDPVRTLLRLPVISNMSSFRQHTTECVLSFDSGPDIEAVSNVSEFLGGALNMFATR